MYGLLVKNLPTVLQCGRPGFDPWVREDPLEKEMATQSSSLAWRVPWAEDPGGLPSPVAKSRTRLSDFTSLWGMRVASLEWVIRECLLECSDFASETWMKRKVEDTEKKMILTWSDALICPPINFIPVLSASHTFHPALSWWQLKPVGSWV